jgi:hypothetical protein
MNIEEYKEKSRQRFKNFLGDITVKTTALDTLKNAQWSSFTEVSISESELANRNVDFDIESCLTRALLCVLITEKYFPESKIQVAEVCEDLCRNYMLQTALLIPVSWDDPTFIEELLMYECPHFAVFVDGIQFDPLVLKHTHLPQQHPKVNILPEAWTALFAAYLVSVAHQKMKKNDIFEQGRILHFAHSLCPQLLVPQENLISFYSSMGDNKRLVAMCENIFRRRADAKMLWGSFMLTQDKKYYDEFFIHYNEKVFNHILSQIL